MHWREILRLFGILLAIYSLSFLPSLGVALFYDDGQWQVFATSLLGTALLGIALWLPTRRSKEELSMRDGFLVVTLFWVLLGLVGAVPMVLGINLSITDAVFESISGFTGTGATVIVGLDRLPISILYHRQQIQWLGGMGIIVLAVALLPLLGVGGMQLYRAESSGVSKNEKLTPRIGETARALWVIYATLTVCCALAFWFAGMRPFDAIGHAYATLATGGFSTHDASLAHYDSVLIEGIAIVFMALASLNFAVHFTAWRRRSWRHYVSDSEARAFVAILLTATLVITLSLYSQHSYSSLLTCLRHSAFQVTSFLSSTGFVTADYVNWPLHVPLTLAVVAFIGGCAGSTAGGVKVMRVVLLGKLAYRQLFQLAHPNAVSVIKLGRRPVAEQALYSVWGFTVLFALTTMLLTLAMMAAGLDFESAFGAVMATITLVGPGLGDVAANFANVSATVKWLGVFGMLAGRLEVFTLLILFMPAYWRH